MDDANVVKYLQSNLGNMDLAMKVAARAKLPGAEQLYSANFDQLLRAGDIAAAAEMVLSLLLLCRYKSTHTDAEEFLVGGQVAQRRAAHAQHHQQIQDSRKCKPWRAESAAYLLQQDSRGL